MFSSYCPAFNNVLLHHCRISLLGKPKENEPIFIPLTTFQFVAWCHMHHWIFLSHIKELLYEMLLWQLSPPFLIVWFHTLFPNFFRQIFDLWWIFYQDLHKSICLSHFSGSMNFVAFWIERYNDMTFIVIFQILVIRRW